MKLLAVVTPPSIYCGCSNQKTFWEEEFTPANMTNGGRHNVRKHRETKNGEKYIILDISLDFGSLDKMKTKILEPKDYLGRSGKGLITSLGLKTTRRSKKIEKARFAITNVSLKGIYNIIKEFEDLPYEDYARNRFKHMPTDSYLYLAIQLCKLYDEIKFARLTCKNTNY